MVNFWKWFWPRLDDNICRACGSSWTKIDPQVADPIRRLLTRKCNFCEMVWTTKFKYGDYLDD